ncbi:uncharacterized protein N7498_001635 [Penicillium cinerascens]|uniref:Uncharacterized protein n=1 Tax=Penicillium cinerascens TaxID=70096 RepID=A0A9W9NA20_9EURO|nr:uncharacterized protein N7498_001635 [Penicillium cinerascens]KAJ5215228.1 hypothetical protein N7498_001635 [Penicillium cinerascens]
MKPGKKKVLAMKVRYANPNRLYQRKRSVKAHHLAWMSNLEAVTAAKLYENSTEKRNWSILRHADSISLQNVRKAEREKQGSFKNLSEREEQIERYRKSENKATKRQLKKGLAGDIEILKSEMEDLKKKVNTLQPLLSERHKRKRVFPRRSQLDQKSL